ncbi:hypothetical protein [Pseudomonas sp. D2002]|uniref:hypothetical protein n=1 Tax=Pseudomonas sp. D2002 TaxID=2726980 RepID=UPI0015A43FF5|nr:hypothetical protein [Pseudomonas sp. D2002]NWA81742.1 hypothetical protein [Pseudomonas sp. D2002]
MTNIAPSAFFLSPMTPQVAPSAGSADAHNRPNNEYNRITVTEENYPRVIDLLSEAARRNDTQVSIQEPTSSDLDYGDGPMKTETFSFNFDPDKADGTYSPKYRDAVNNTNQLFNDWLRVEGIKNYGPES